MGPDAFNSWWCQAQGGRRRREEGGRERSSVYRAVETWDAEHIGRQARSQMAKQCYQEERDQHFTSVALHSTDLKSHLKVPYYTVFHQYIIGLRYIQNMARNTKRITRGSMP